MRFWSGPSSCSRSGEMGWLLHILCWLAFALAMVSAGVIVGFALQFAFDLIIGEIEL